MDDFTFRSVKFEPIQFKTNSLTSLPLKDIRDGLVLDTGFTVRRGSDDVDQSGEHSDLTLSGPSRAKGMGNMNALSFDGIDDLLYDKVYATEEGTVYISTANGQAFLIDTGQDFSDYVGDGSDNGYMVVVYDAADKVAWAYGGVEGSGETLGSELATNGDFTNWTGDDPDDWNLTGAENASNYVTENPAGQCQIVSDGSLIGINHVILTVGKLYLYSIDIKSIAGTLQLYNDGATPRIIDNYTTPGIKTGYITATGTTLTIKRRAGALDCTIDDVSVKEVTAPPATTGIKLYSTINGSTENMAGVDGAFAPNDTLTYDIRKSSMSFDSNQFSLIFLVYLNANDGDRLFSCNWANNGSVVVWFHGGKIQFGTISDDGSEDNRIESVSTITTDAWHGIICTMNTTTGNKYIYLDGTEDKSASGLTSSLSFGGNAPIFISTTSAPLDGKIGLVRFYRGVAVTAIQVRQLYNYILYKAGMIDISYRGM